MIEFFFLFEMGKVFIKTFLDKERIQQKSWNNFIEKYVRVWDWSPVQKDDMCDRLKCSSEMDLFLWSHS